MSVAGAREEQAPRGRPEERRESSLHSARSRITLSGWLRLPAARRRARKAIVPERPWIVPAAIGWLRRRIRRDWSVLELGAGRSTPWFARRAGRVLSLEDNGYWLQQARDRLDQLGLHNAELRELPVEEFAGVVEGLDDESLDLVVVDFLESPEADRVDSVRVARAKVRPGGYLLLDDSDRSVYAEAYELLTGWRERRFVGVKDGWPTVCETSIFRRPK